jgi:TonB-linked SusC/RagA family outer membrane protein
MRKNLSGEKNDLSFPPKQLFLAMKLTTLFLFVMCMQVHATGWGQERINLRLEQSTIRHLLKEVEKQTAYRFVYHTGTLPENRLVNVTATEAKLGDVLDEAFKGLALHYTMKESNLVVIYADEAAYDKVLRGRVTAKDNSPLANVSIKVSGSSIGVITDNDGGYTLRTPDNAVSLEFSLVGYQSQTITIGDHSVINVQLEQLATNMSEVVVTGYTNYSRSKSASASSEVLADKINDVPIASFEQSLQGRVPGVDIESVSGQPGTSASVRMRGVGTINGNSDVLYILDGVPIESGAFQSINAQDIESVTALKDASSKALYGSRGSNGVIVITTKKGKAGQLSVNYKSQYGVSLLTTPNFNMMNTPERKQFEEELGAEGADAGPFWTYSKKNPDYATKTPDEQHRADAIVDSLLTINTDWRDYFFRHGKFMEQQLSFSGGNEHTRFYTSLNYYNQDGISIRSGLKRYTLKNNLDFNMGRLTANVNLNIGYSSSSFIESEGFTSGNNPMAAVYYGLPYEYPYAPDGKLVTSGDGADYPVLDLREGSNSLERALNSTNNSNQFKGILSTSLSYLIADGLSAKTKLGVDFTDNVGDRWINPDSYAGFRQDFGAGLFTENFQRRFSLVTTSGLTYNKIFSDVHDLEVSGYFEFLSNRKRGFGYTGYGIDPRLPQTPAGVGSTSTYTPDLTGARTRNALASYIGLLRYTYNNKYTFNGSYRTDGTSTLPTENRWHGFYSAGVSWEAKRESFLENVSAISTLRVRASYGTTASPVGGDFLYLPTYGTASYGGNAALIPVQPGNENRDWEYAREFNAGFDLALLKNRIRVVADFYNRLTTNLYFGAPVSSTAGIPETDDYPANTIPQSLGKMRNRGVELDLQGDIVKNKAITWTLGGNVAYNKNRIMDLGGADAFVIGGEETSIIKVGLPFGALYAPRWAGVNPANGDPQYYGADGTITNVYNAVTQSVAGFGSYIPEITGGLNTSANWKNFTLSALAVFTGKVSRYNHEDYFNENPSFVTSNQSKRLLYDRWKKPGDIALLPAITADRRYTSRDIQNSAYLRLRNVSIGYTVPAVVMGRQKVIKGINVFIQGQNLLTVTKWRGFDPENGNEYANYSYPNARTYSAGLNINL